MGLSRKQVNRKIIESSNLSRGSKNIRKKENMLEKLIEMVEELSSTNSINAKVDIIKKYPELQKILTYIYDPFMKFNVTSKNVLKKNASQSATKKFTDIYSLLDALASREITGHAALGCIQNFVADLSKQDQEIVYLIIDKNLKCRIDASLINKAFPDLIPQFDVALAKSYDEYIDKIEIDANDPGNRWLASRKLDGVRVICIKKGKNVNFYSREGNEFLTLSKVADEVLAKLNGDWVLDGEMCIVDDQGNEDFKAIVSQIKRKDFTIENPKYILFDMLTLPEFYGQETSEILSVRLDRLYYWENDTNLKFISIANQILLQNKARLDEMRNEIDENWEGLMIRKDVPYEGKRTKNLLKVKAFQDAEYVVTGIKTGPYQIVNTKTNRPEEIVTMTAVSILHKGNEVSVGSGFSLEERNRYFENPDLIVGKTISVRYFEESEDENGKLSLRFPTVKVIYGEGRDI